MRWKRALAFGWKFVLPALGTIGAALSVIEWPDRLRSLLAMVGMIDSETARWTVMIVSLVAIASPVVFWRVGTWIERRRHKRFQNLGYVDACGTVNAYIKFSANVGGHFVAHTILTRFEEVCPEGVPERAVYNGYLLNSWLRFNAAELLVNNRSALKRLPDTKESPK